MLNRFFALLLPKSFMWKLNPYRNLSKFFEVLAEGLVRPFGVVLQNVLARLFDFASDDWQKVFKGSSWLRTGSQTKSRLEEILASKGFPCLQVWEGVTEKPEDVLNTIIVSQAGDVSMQAGSTQAQAGYTLDNSGYVLVNRIAANTITPLCQAGASNLQCGDLSAQCGNFYQVPEQQKQYSVPQEPYSVVYVGGCGLPLGELTTLDGQLKVLFEQTVLKYFPANVWIGVLIKWQYEPDVMLYEDSDKMLYEDSDKMQYENIER